MDSSDHCMIGVTCGKKRECIEGKKNKWKEKWDIRNVDWIKYYRGQGEAMPGESEEVGQTVSELERDIKEHKV